MTVIDGLDAKATALSRDAVRLANGLELPGAVTVRTVGFEVPDLAARSGLSTDAMGRASDERLTSMEDERILAAGTRQRRRTRRCA
ncbi:hypothetical protein AB0L61_16410 [Streptomyces tendae]|uniref:hypothetical protein n=1 Tax=Streptomyces tendae TaxID=1932 RepID=UPI003423DD11